MEIAPIAPTDPEVHELQDLIGVDAAMFLVAFARFGSISAASKHLGLTPTCHYQWAKQKDDAAREAYLRLFNRARELATDHLEAEAHRRGVLGTSEPVIYQGRMCYVTAPEWVEAAVDVEGVTTPGHWEDRPVLGDDGRPIPLTVTRYSDNLLALLLRGNAAKYRTSNAEVTGKDGSPLGPLVQVYLPDNGRNDRD